MLLFWSTQNSLIILCKLSCQSCTRILMFPLIKDTCLQEVQICDLRIQSLGSKGKWLASVQWLNVCSERGTLKCLYRSNKTYLDLGLAPAGCFLIALSMSDTGALSILTCQYAMIASELETGRWWATRRETWKSGNHFTNSLHNLTKMQCQKKKRQIKCQKKKLKGCQSSLKMESVISKELKLLKRKTEVNILKNQILVLNICLLESVGERAPWKENWK